MIALFDRHSQLVAWLGDEGYNFLEKLKLDSLCCRQLCV